MDKKIILASGSPRKKELLTSTGLIFEAILGDYEEDMTLPLNPNDLAIKLSQGKAEDVAKNQKNAIIIGADMFVSYNGKVIGKPYTKEKAKEILSMLSGNTHSIFSGFTVIDTENNNKISQVSEVKVTFKKLSEEEIDNYVNTSEPLDKAGAYAIQGAGRSLIERFEGDYNSIIGLPINAILKVLKDLGVSVPNQK